MKLNKSGLFFVMTLSLASASALANETGNTNDNGPFTGGGEVNANLSTGNTDIKTYGASAFMDYKADVLTTRVKAGYMMNRTDNRERARRIDGSIRTGFNVSNNVDLFGLGTYMQNPFKGIGSEVMVTPGLGIYAVNSDAVSIRAEGGLGYLWESYVPDQLGHHNFTVGTAGAGMRFKISDVADISDDFNYIVPFAQSSDWRINNVAALTSALTKHLALKVSYTVEHREIPVVTHVANDTFTTASLVVKL